MIVRALHPAASRIEVRLVDTGALHPMRRRAPDGIFELSLPTADVPDYRLRLSFLDGHVLEIDDPYRYGRVLTDFDVYLFGEGTHLRIFEKLGAHRILGVSAAHPEAIQRALSRYPLSHP